MLKTSQFPLLPIKPSQSHICNWPMVVFLTIAKQFYLPQENQPHEPHHPQFNIQISFTTIPNNSTLMFVTFLPVSLNNPLTHSNIKFSINQYQILWTKHHKSTITEQPTSIFSFFLLLLFFPPSMRISGPFQSN